MSPDNIKAGGHAGPPLQRMMYDPEIHHRRSIRLRGYDYSREGAYFVTICTQDRECLFGDIVEGELRPNDAAMMIGEWWMELERKFPHVVTDHFVVMPNHFHGILFLVGADLCVRPFSYSAEEGAHAGAPLHQIVQWFKTMSTNAYIEGVRENSWPSFPGRLWQRNYHERIIRNDAELAAFREYIRDNPAKWNDDGENPETGTRF